jgi:cytochrome c oxidase cbb3-type subunit 2
MTKSNATWACFIVLTILTVSVGGLVEIVPLFFQKSTTTPVERTGQAV